MSKRKIRIKSIEIAIGDKSIKLTPKELEDLHTELSGLLGRPTEIIKERPYYPWHWYNTTNVLPQWTSDTNQTNQDSITWVGTDKKISDTSDWEPMEQFLFTTGHHQ